MRAPARQKALAVLRWLIVLAVTWGVVVWLTGGMAGSIGGLRLSARNYWHPLALAAAALLAHLFLGGIRSTCEAFGRLVASPAAVVFLSFATVAQGVIFNSNIGGGSDSYGYLSQAELWLSGSLVTPIPETARVPWPDGLSSFTPLAYVPAAHGAAIVPICPPGLPLLMAAAKLVAGRRAMFWVVPLCGGLLVWMTYLIGRRVASRSVGLAASALVATSPAMLNVLMSPMSDVPAAAWWALATYGLLADSFLSGAVAGLGASIAVLIRPNLVPLAGAFTLWLLWPIRRAEFRRRAVLRTVAFWAGISPGIAAVAYLNNQWYGSPFRSGYGSLGNLFSFGRIGTNAAHYGRWIAETETPLALAGLLALCVLSLRFWKTEDARRCASLLALIVLTVVPIYLLYEPFDAWWYLRFLLPIWPAMFIGTAFLVSRMVDRPGWGGSVAFVAVMCALLVFGMRTAREPFRAIYAQKTGELKYVAAAALVDALTEPSSVILSVQQSGSLRYYAGRPTIRFDWIASDWLDRSIQWLDEHGTHPYLLLEEFERDEFRARFARTSELGTLDIPPVVVYHGPTTVYLYDLAAAGPRPPAQHVTRVALSPDSFLPKPLPRLQFSGR